jgi:NADH-quinone oxidoreductase subunit L
LDWIVPFLWLIPALPLIAAAAVSLVPKTWKRFAATAAISSIGGSSVLALLAFGRSAGKINLGEPAAEVFNFPWFDLGAASLRLGWLLDPLTAVMLVMVCLVGLLIFIYSVGYMAHDDNFTRFFCFLALFASAMLGVVISNSLLLFFICWELVGLTSYLLIGFWFHKPEAAAAAKKAFITTRIGDLAFLLGMVWLYAETGTLLFYDAGQGCLEQSALAALVARSTSLGLAASTGIGLLIFAGAIGKSGQLPLHVWLPDAMEGPTPVSALIHAATMVAAGVFLVARVYPLMAASSGTLTVVTWVGVLTALVAASIAVAQNDIKRILAYSTVSQLGFMMMGIGVGGVAAGIFHLITHAFFKALLFMGAGSVIHGCHEEQDVRKMGGLRQFMPVTFVTYIAGMLALSGFPLLFSGFWSKDEILHAAHGWKTSQWPFYLGLTAAFLTAFYMTRQVCHVFLGSHRANLDTHAKGDSVAHPHESPPVMTIPLAVLSFFAVFLGFLGTPAWPWFQHFLQGKIAVADFPHLFSSGSLVLIGLSSLIALGGIAAGWWFYGRHPLQTADEPDAVERLRPDIFGVLRNKYYFDEVYEVTFVSLNAWWSRACNWLEFWVWNGLVLAAGYITLGLSWVNRAIDEYVVNLGFDRGCEGIAQGGGRLSRLQAGQVQTYLRVIGLALVVLVLILIWGCRA